MGLPGSRMSPTSQETGRNGPHRGTCTTDCYLVLRCGLGLQENGHVEFVFILPRGGEKATPVCHGFTPQYKCVCVCNTELNDSQSQSSLY